jgi:hypothetical protein
MSILLLAARGCAALLLLGASGGICGGGALAGAAAPAPAAQAIDVQAVDVTAYAGILAGIEHDLAAALAAARARADGSLVRAACGRAASALERLRVRWQGEELLSDPGLLALLRAGQAGSAIRVLEELRLQLAGGIAGVAAPRAGAAPAAEAPARTDQDALGRIQAEQQERHDAAGGDLGDLPLHESQAMHTWGERLVDALRWLHDEIAGIIDWLANLFPHGGGAGGGGFGHTTILALVLTGALVVVLIAFAILRKSAARAPAPLSLATATARDADPTSRPADEWRRYAEDLAAQGRWREAVRAHYHAVLVMSWQAGLIQHRVGRTNWEYAAMLPASWGERGAFIEITRGFELAWYGGQADGEACRAFADRVEQLAQLLARRGRW